MTIRRIILDKYLQKTIYFGSVLDVGGKAQNKRGGYRPNLDSVKSWEYLNLDESSSPDYLMDVKDLGQINKTFDCILLCEVLEHVEFPEAAHRAHVHDVALGLAHQHPGQPRRHA